MKTTRPRPQRTPLPQDEAGIPATPPRADAKPGGGEKVDIGKSYDTYFASGLYQSRYPRPNRRTLRTLEQLLPIEGRLLDYGAGEGRYCLSLAKSHAAHVVAVDISTTARVTLANRARDMNLADRVVICEPGDAIYRTEVSEDGGFNVALLGFGVLGHVAGRSRRMALLLELRDALLPHGHLVLGLPNAMRRFRAEQARYAPRVQAGEFEEGDIQYERVSDAGTVPLFYHLFHGGEIQADLTEAGYVIERMTSESMLPETVVTKSKTLALIDDLACSALPADLGYGYLVIARPRN
ncbi:bifunctional 2-polyprenyl-6-hydroxyphenol methylase/3-demethylubiquinol 3-O-methyltransferase UbiG [Mesorhizobium sp. J428]|uniref:class I SAM-dependent methyltransferase n=1 Tax=Mesorhizobium sp. J428 TaxID=2898440 RepID=UPI0021518B61|nr:class I SAM-dependent methyltransferase [Mesorhizobium sp. J428]MCR5858651.1 class I SAM-dependent methyltransferase [Mesorhizobium sp. J428]